MNTPAATATTITLEMGISLKVFDDTLPNASTPYTIDKISDGYQLTNDGLSIVIKLVEKPPRKIASLTIPVTNVELIFSEHSTEDIEKFMFRFKRYFHRGGG